MARFKALLVGAVALAFSAGSAFAQTTVKWLHIEANPVVVKLWEEVARDFEAKNPGVKVEMRNVLGDAEHCEASGNTPGCLEEANRGWVPFGQMSLPGRRTCVSSCKCRVDYRRKP